MSEATKNLELLKAAAVDPRVKMTAQMAIDEIEQMADELQGERWDIDIKDKEIERLQRRYASDSEHIEQLHKLLARTKDKIRELRAALEYVVGMNKSLARHPEIQGALGDE